MDKIHELELKTIDISEKQKLLNDKLTSVNANLTTFNNSLKERNIPDHLYKKYLEAREIYIKDKNSYLVEQRELKIDKQKISFEIEALKRALNSITDDTIKSDLILIKDNYFDFYRDKSRIASMRKMASDFIIELDKVIKKI